MNRPFTETDNGKRFVWRGRPAYRMTTGRLEFPLTDPGSAEPGEGILWFDKPDEDGSAWDYVAPQDVEEVWGD